jgi:hypothetical protein
MSTQKYIISLSMSFLLCFFHNNQIHGKVIRNLQIHSEKQNVINKNSERHAPLILGVQAGVSRVSIDKTGYFEADKIYANYQLVAGISLQKILENNFGLSSTLSYKNLGFSASSTASDYSFALKTANHYLSVQFALHYFPERINSMSFFGGFDVLTLFSSNENYWRKYSSYEYKEDLRFDAMKKIMKRYFLSIIAGVGYKFSFQIPINIFVQTEYSMLSPTVDRQLAEGDYNPLPYPFKFMNFSITINIPIFNLK